MNPLGMNQMTLVQKLTLMLRASKLARPSWKCCLGVVIRDHRHERISFLKHHDHSRSMAAPKIVLM